MALAEVTLTMKFHCTYMHDMRKALITAENTHTSIKEAVKCKFGVTEPFLVQIKYKEGDFEDFIDIEEENLRSLAANEIHRIQVHHAHVDPLSVPNTSPNFRNDITQSRLVSQSLKKQLAKLCLILLFHDSIQ